MNILLLTDFSQNARNASAYALQLFKDLPCTFHFLHVTPVRGRRLHDSCPPEIDQKFQELRDWVSGKVTNAAHHFTFSYRVDFFIEAVREVGLEKDIDLIMMGTRGTGKSKGLKIGQNTAPVFDTPLTDSFLIIDNQFFK